MAHGTFTRSTPAGEGRERRDLLFKADHPRAIDEYIDFFGGATDTHADEHDDVGGEVVLERPA